MKTEHWYSSFKVFPFACFPNIGQYFLRTVIKYRNNYLLQRLNKIVILQVSETRNYLSPSYYLTGITLFITGCRSDIHWFSVSKIITWTYDYFLEWTGKLQVDPPVSGRWHPVTWSELWRKSSSEPQSWSFAGNTGPLEAGTIRHTSQWLGEASNSQGRARNKGGCNSAAFFYRHYFHTYMSVYLVPFYCFFAAINSGKKQVMKKNVLRPLWAGETLAGMQHFWCIEWWYNSTFWKLWAEAKTLALNNQTIFI